MFKYCSKGGIERKFNVNINRAYTLNYDLAVGITKNSKQFRIIKPLKVLK